LIGERVNNYQIISLLGEGGMGAVYLAEHPFMGRKAAIKVLRREFAEDANLVERFMNEARAANAIRHPNIIDIIDVGRLPSGIPYLMMEYLEGQALAARIQAERTLGIPDALNVGIQTASALKAAHAKGIVHRDLKPDNLFLVPDDAGSLSRVKVLDFGIAKLRAELSGGSGKTQAGAIMGTPPYMSPEQCRGVSDEIDHRSDIYSLGIILYEMLSGAPPFMGAGWGDVVLMHITQPPSPLRAKNAAVSPQLEAIVMKALHKRPDDRWASMAELETALRNVQAAPVATLSGTGASAGMPRAEAQSAPATTLRGSAGQVGASADDDEPALPRPLWKRPAALVIGGVAVVGIAAFVVLGGGGKRPAGEAAAPSALAPPVAAPAAAGPPPAAAPPAPPPAAPPAAAAPAAAPAPAGEKAAVPPPADSAPVAAAPARSAGNKSGEARSADSKPAEAKSGHGKKGAHHAEAAPAGHATPAGHTKPGCDPNFYFDAQGEKHFKPECF